MYHSKLKTGNTLAVFFLLFFSLIFRFVFSATHISFGQDVARDAWLIEQRINQGNLIVDYGPKASVGNFYLPPLYYQLHVFFSLLTNNDPLTMKWVITFVEALSPVLLFLILRQIFDSKLALLTGLLYIIAPIPLQYGTTAWNPNMIPFFSLLFLYSGIQIMKYQKFWFVPIFCLACITAFQFHYQSAVLVLFFVFIALYSIQKFTLRRIVSYWAVGLLVIILTLLPYGIAEYRSQFKNTKAIIDYFSSEHSQYFERVSKPTYILTYFPKFFDRVMLSKETYHSIIGICLYFGGSLVLLIRYRKTKNIANLFILFYFFSIVLMLRVFKGDKLDYYLSTLYFIPFILLASVLSITKSNVVTGSIFGLMFFSLGIHLSQWYKYDDLASLKESVAYLQSTVPTQNVRFIFHDDDFVNSMYFGVNKFSTLTLDKNSSTIIDICNNRDVCVWDTTPASKHSLANSKVGFFKSDSQYQQLSYRYGKVPFQIIIGSIKNPSVLLDTTGFNYQGERGSDFLMEY